MPTVLVKAFDLMVNDKSFEVEAGKCLFDELDQHGLELPHGCLAGSCGACRVEIVEGAENISKPGVIETDTIHSIIKETNSHKTIRLACRLKVLGNITIKVLK